MPSEWRICFVGVCDEGICQEDVSNALSWQRSQDPYQSTFQNKQFWSGFPLGQRPLCLNQCVPKIVQLTVCKWCKWQFVDWCLSLSIFTAQPDARFLLRSHSIFHIWGTEGLDRNWFKAVCSTPFAPRRLPTIVNMPKAGWIQQGWYHQSTLGKMTQPVADYFCLKSVIQMLAGAKLQNWLQ